MLFAGFACVLGGTGSEGTSTVETSNVSEGIEIGEDGKIAKNPAEFKATYDEGTHTLSFNEDITVESSTFLIYSSYENTLIIEINSNVVFTATSAPQGAEVFGCIMAEANTTIRGSGSLTLNAPTAERGVSGIFNNSGNINIEGIELIINSSKDSACFYGISCVNTLTITGATVTIDASGPSSTEDETTCGLHCDNNITIIQSHINILVGNTTGIYAEASMAIYDSLIEITGTESNTDKTVGIMVSEGEVNEGELEQFIIARSRIVMDLSKGPVMGGICSSDPPITLIDCSISMVFSQGPSLEESMAICAPLGVSANNCVISIKGSIDYAIGADGAEGPMILDGCLISLDVSGVGISGKGVGISFSTVSIVSGGFAIDSNQDEPEPELVNEDVPGNIIIDYSDVNVKSTGTTAFGTGTTVTITNCEKTLGSDGSVEPTQEITTGYDTYKWVHVVTPQIISFNLGEGEGTGVKPIIAYVGEKITLPECDAVSGENGFIGWTDGYKLYQAGDEYTVATSTTLFAVYGDPIGPQPGSSSDNNGIIILAAILFLAVLAIVAIVYWSRS